MLRRIIAAIASVAGRLKLQDMALYATVFVFVFGAVFYLSFPFNTIKSLMVTQIEAKTGTKVTIEDLHPLRMSGMEAKGVRLAKPDDPANIIAIVDLLRFRLHLLPLLRARTIVDFDLEAYGGGLSGVMEARTGYRVAMAVNFQDLDVNKYNFARFVEDYGEMRLHGQLSGHFNLYVDGNNRRNSSGDLDVKADGLKIANVTILGKSLPDVNFEPSAIKMDLKRNAFTISEWTMNGDNLSVNMTGRLTVGENLQRSRLSFTLKAKPSDAVMDEFPELAMMKTPDAQGWYTLRLNGPLSKPNANFR